MTHNTQSMPDANTDCHLATHADLTEPMPPPTYYHVDVFANGPLSGNGLTVFLNTEGWSRDLMQRLAQEMKQFESIFLSEITSTGAKARVFTVDEELGFAGHPVLGAAAVLHQAITPTADERCWQLHLPVGLVPVVTRKVGEHIVAEMDQGQPVLGPTLTGTALAPVLQRMGLRSEDRVPELVPQVISTGLPYLILPVRPSALARTTITGTDLEAHLAALGAKFVLVLDVAARELRTWDNLGRVEDIATGSAASPVAAYLQINGLAAIDEKIEITQGRFVGRPSKINVRADQAGALHVSGEVWPVAQGMLDAAVLSASV